MRPKTTTLPGRGIAATGCSPFSPTRYSPLPSFCKTTVCRWRCVPSAAFLFGTAFLWPGVTDAATIRIFAAYAFVDGILALAPGGWGMAFRLGWPLLIGGVIDLGGSVIAYVWPDMSLSALGGVAAGWAIASSFAFAAAYTTLHRSDRGQLFLLCAIASMVLGRALLSSIPLDAIVLSTWLGLYAMTVWVLLLKLTLKQYSTMFL